MRRLPLKDDVLRKLGLSRGRIAKRSSTVRWPQDLVGRGKGVTAPTGSLGSMAASAYAGLEFLPTRLPALERAGWRLELLSSSWLVLKLSAPPGASPVAHPLESVPGTHQRDPDDPDTVLLDLGAGGPTAALLADGSGFLLAPGEQRLDVVEILAERLEADGLREAIRGFARSCGDPWLAEEVGERLQGASDSWGLAATGGLCARLLEPEDRRRTRALVERTLAGLESPELSQPRVWARRLDPKVVRRIEKETKLRISRVAADVKRFGSLESLGEPGWQKELLDLCHRRDDLECVRVLLAEASSGAKRTSGLVRLDRAGRSLMAGLPVGPEMEDERLRRVASLDPGAWWGWAFASDLGG